MLRGNQGELLDDCNGTQQILSTRNVRVICCPLFQFSCLMILIFILELSAGIAGYVLRDQTAAFLRNELNSSMTRYRIDDYNEITRMWDVIQDQVRNY